MADNVIGIKFGVAGGKGFLSGSSGALIKEQLEHIASRINLKININKTYFKNQLAALKTELDKTLGELNINVRANINTEGRGNSSGGGNGAQQQVASYESVTKTLEKLYQTKVKLLKLSDKEKSGTVNGALLSRQAEELTDTYKEQLAQLEELLGADDQRVKSVQKLQQELKKVYQVQQDSANTPEMANPTALAKLGVKAQSLYTDNGFDKIIARSKKAAQLVDDFNAKVQATLNQEDGVTKATKDEVAKLNTEFLNTQARLKEIGRETDTLGNKVKEAFDSRVIQRIAQMLLLTMLRALKQVYDNVKKIDTAMTELKIVTNATANQMDAAANKIASAAKKIGASISDLTNSTTVYARLGYSLSDAQTLAEKTTVYANVAGVNVSEATTNITGIIKAFNIGADGLEAVLDQLIYVGNNFAISQAEIGEAMNNAASALVANGNTLQEAIGIITAANTSLQNVSKSSTAVRTVAARISKSTAELEELGEDAGSIMATADLANAMSAYGVAITNTNGELRSTYDILNDLSKIWSDLDSTSQAAIANMLAGTRQQNAFYSIMQNWKDAQQVVEESTKSTGALASAQAKYLDSIEGKVGQLTAAWEEFSANILDSDLVKFFVDVLKAIVNALDAITSLGNGIVTKFAVVTAVTVGLISLINKLKAAILSFTGATTLSLNVIGTAIQSFMAKATPILILSTIVTLLTSLSGKAQGAAELIVGVIAFIATSLVLYLHFVDEEIKLFESSNPLGWILLAITAVVAVVKGIFDLIESFNPSYETLKEAAQESIDAWKDVEDELADVEKKLDDIQDKIDQINSKGNKISIIDKEELKYLEQEKANLEAIAAEQETEAKKAKQQAAADAAAALGKYNETKTKGGSKRWQWLISSWWGIAEEIKESKSDTQQEKLDKILRDYKNASKEDKDFVTSALNEYSELLDGFTFGDNSELDKYLEQYYSILDRYNIQTGKSEVTWNRILKDTRFSNEVNRLKELADAQDVTLESILKNAPEFIEYLKEIGIYTEGDASSSNALINGIKDLRTRLQELQAIDFTDDLSVMQDKFDSLNNALKDMADNGVVSLENISKIFDSTEGYPTLLSKYFEFVEGIGYRLTETYRDKTNTQILTEMVTDSLQEYVNAYDEAVKTLEAMSEDDEDYKTAVNNVATAQENLNKKTAEWATLLREQAIADETKRMEKEQDVLEERIDVYKDLIDIRKDLLQTYAEEVNYQKELAAKQKTIADLQTQLSLARLDKSAAGQARVRELEQELTDAEDELSEYTLERAIEDITTEIDSAYSEYEKFIREQVDLLQETIENLAKNFVVTVQLPNSNISNSNISAFEQAKQYIISNGMMQGDKGRWVQDPAFRELWNQLTSEEKERLKGYTYGNPVYDAEGRLLRYEKVAPVYHSGGLVGNISVLKSNEEFAKLMKGEFVSTPSQMENFIKKTLPGMFTYGDTGEASIIHNAPLIEIKCGEVDGDTLPKLKTLVDQAVTKIEKNMESALSRTGYKKKH